MKWWEEENNKNETCLDTNI